MATDPWAGFEEVNPSTAAPAFPGVIPGRPKVAPPPSPIELERLDISRSSNARGERSEARQAAKDAITIEQSQQQNIPNAAAAGIQENLKSLGLVDTALKTLSGRPQSIGPGTGMLGDTVTQFNDPEGTDVRRIIGEIGAVKIHDLSGAAVSASEAPRFMPFVPKVTDRPEVARKKLEGFRHEMALYLKEMDDYYSPANRYLPYTTPAMQALRDNGFGMSTEGENPATDKWPGVVGEDGKPLPPEGGYGKDPETGEWGLYGNVTYEGPTPERQEAAQPSERQDSFLGSVGDLVEGASSLPGVVINPIGQALYDVTGYGDQKYDLGTIVREGLGLPRNSEGLLRNVNTFGASALTGGIAARSGALLANPGVTRNVLTALGESPIRDTAAGAGAGAGAYAGEKVGGTPGAVVGGILGGVAGYGGAGALANLGAPRQVNAAAAALRDAGAAEGVTVNRAMVDPLSANRVSKADASLIGGKRVQRGMTRIEGQIEGRVQALGRDGQPMDDIALGDTVKRAGERAIEQTGKIAKRKYDRAERLAGDAKVTPQESLRRVDEMIGRLGETPGTNSSELAFLQEIKSDLSRDLSVGGLRRMRTKLRKKISKGDLVFGEDEANVLSIMDGAADDIRSGLVQQGAEDAADAFDAADKSYRARMEYVTGTVQKLLGKRNSNLSAEQIARKFTSMTSQDARSLRKFYATLEPDEAADVAATFAERLGTNNKDGFTVAQFMRQTSSKNMSDEAIRTLFGNEGAQSVRNLRTVGREVERVTGAMNSRTSKSGVANYRDYLFSFIAGTLPGAASGNLTATGATAAAGVGLKAGVDAITANLLMSPKITKWMTQAPRTTDPKAINAHFARLAAIAKQEPALAADIKGLQESIMRAANDNVGRSGAAVASPNQGPEEEKPR